MEKWDKYDEKRVKLLFFDGGVVVGNLFINYTADGVELDLTEIEGQPEYVKYGWYETLDDEMTPAQDIKSIKKIEILGDAE
ncbi:MAG: hypothetical protein LBT99_01395 [Bifidobacteriaceae bacterium]|jgi:hypothetical protein|nr:hypothetical protein [Bifidobacteriaceae bacterium]